MKNLIVILAFIAFVLFIKKEFHHANTSTDYFFNAIGLLIFILYIAKPNQSKKK